MAVAVQRKTPGVYVTELSAFPPSVVGVDTAVPAFIGYTQMALLNGAPVKMTPVPIASLAEFQETFGGDYPSLFQLKATTTTTAATTNQPPAAPDVMMGGKGYTITQKPQSARFCLYNSLRLFYANGGGNCYIVSVGTYGDGSAASVIEGDLSNGLDAINDQIGPTMLVVPDAVLLPADPPAPAAGGAPTTAPAASVPPTCAKFDLLVQKMILQCSTLGDRVALLDVYGTDQLSQLPPGNSAGSQAFMESLVTNFRDNSVGTPADPDAVSYGMAYFPWLHTSVVDDAEMGLDNFDLADATTLAALKQGLTDEATGLYSGGVPADLTTAINGIAASADLSTTDKTLTAHIPVLGQVFSVLADKLSFLPPSAAMAGVYTQIDASRGVWNAPANVGLTGVIAPTFKITDATQGDLNVPINGKAINAIRDFVGRGTLVWGARTLDGNSNDYRYIQVRRTLVYIEQSVKDALNQFVFAPNDAQTWVSVTAMISNFLTGLWTQGGLMGSKASEAFTVLCGLGSTMTGQDVLNGYMRVQVTLQMIHPAEFIELTFTQQMQGVG